VRLGTYTGYKFSEWIHINRLKKYKKRAQKYLDENEIIQYEKLSELSARQQKDAQVAHLLEKRISVFWYKWRNDPDHGWKMGTVKSYNAKRNKFMVSYDDIEHGSLIPETLIGAKAAKFKIIEPILTLEKGACLQPGFNDPDNTIEAIVARFGENQRFFGSENNDFMIVDDTGNAPMDPYDLDYLDSDDELSID